MVREHIYPVLRAAAAAALLTLAACAGPLGDSETAETSTSVTTEATNQASAPGTAEEYKISNGEKLRITIAGEDKLTGEYVVGADGQIAFPLLGKITAAGLSAHGLEESLVAKLKGRYLVRPHAVVELTSLRPFYVIGEVKNTGEFPYKPGLNVVTALALAGGYTARASSSYVYIKRASEQEEKEFEAGVNVPIMPGDIIRVPERYF
jgi:protein involved in polysaccharide export with SLBB domain